MSETKNKDSLRILVVDDEESLRCILTEVLIDDGHQVTAVASGEEALDVFKKELFQLVITDIRMGGMNGMELLQEIKNIAPETEVVIITSHASLDTSLTALRAGAYDYLTKPFEDLDLISAVTRRVVDKLKLTWENQSLLEKLKIQNAELEYANQTLNELAIRDGLTGLYNHRHFQEALGTEIVRSSRYNRNFSLVFLDVDFFKRYNDQNGHLAGDELLKTLAQIVSERLRGSDFFARYGGEEFVILLPETDKEEGLEVAEKVRALIADYPFPGQEYQPQGNLTVSLGVSSYPEDGTDYAILLKRADDALYHVKENGRNNVFSWGLKRYAKR